MGNNNSLLDKISKLSTLFIAGATFWGFLITYFNEVGILKYYGVSTRYIQLDIHIFAMSWRAFIALSIIGFLCLIVFIILEKIAPKCTIIKVKIKIEWKHWLFLILMDVFFITVGYYYFIKSFHPIATILLFTLPLLVLTYYIWLTKEAHANEKNGIRILSFLLMIIVVFIGGMESSFTMGYNFAKTKNEYYIINKNPKKVVILENNQFILWSHYNKFSSTFDSSFEITYFPNDTSINLELINIGPIKQRKQHPK